MSSVFAVLLLAWNVMFMCQIGLPLAEGTYCSSNSDCPGKYFNNVCCGRSYYSRQCQTDSCVGRSCSTDGDCGGKDECCISKRCTRYGCAECFSNAGCATSEYCCKHQYHNDHNVCRRSCVGETCHSSDDCGGPSEYCTSNKICSQAGRLCSSSSDCRGDGECCRYSQCVTVGCLACTSNSNCPSSRYCCKRGSLANVCRADCVGQTCYDDDDCGGPGEFCNTNTTKCEKSKTTVAGWVVAVAVVGAVLFVIFVGAIWAYRFCRGSSRRGVVVRREPPRRTTAIIALRETETTIHPAPVYNIPPPAYDNHGQNFPSPQTHQLPSESKQGMPQPQHGYPPSQHAYPQQGYLPPQPQHMYPQPQPGYPPPQPEPGYPPPQPQNAYQPPNALH